MIVMVMNASMSMMAIVVMPVVAIVVMPVVAMSIAVIMMVLGIGRLQVTERGEA
jgi:hypothetical protein